MIYVDLCECNCGCRFEMEIVRSNRDDREYRSTEARRRRGLAWIEALSQLRSSSDCRQSHRCAPSLSPCNWNSMLHPCHILSLFQRQSTPTTRKTHRRHIHTQNGEPRGKGGGLHACLKASEAGTATPTEADLEQRGSVCVGWSSSPVLGFPSMREWNVRAKFRDKWLK